MGDVWSYYKDIKLHEVKDEKSIGYVFDLHFISLWSKCRPC